MTYTELRRRLRRVGMRPIGQGKRHERWMNPVTNATVMIPRHGSQEVPEGTLNHILRELGVNKDKL